MKKITFLFLVLLFAGCQTKSEDVKRSLAFVKESYPTAKITATNEEPYTAVMLGRFNYYAEVSDTPELTDMILSNPNQVLGNMVTVNITMKGTNYEAVFLYQDGTKKGNLLVAMN